MHNQSSKGEPRPCYRCRELHDLLDKLGAPVGSSENGHPMGASVRERIIMLAKQGKGEPWTEETVMRIYVNGGGAPSGFDKGFKAIADAHNASIGTAHTSEQQSFRDAGYRGDKFKPDWAARASEQGADDLLLEASELLDKHLHCNCKWDNGHEPTCAIVKARDWRKRALQRPTPATDVPK